MPVLAEDLGTGHRSCPVPALGGQLSGYAPTAPGRSIHTYLRISCSLKWRPYLPAETHLLSVPFPDGDSSGSGGLGAVISFGHAALTSPRRYRAAKAAIGPAVRSLAVHSVSGPCGSRVVFMVLAAIPRAPCGKWPSAGPGPCRGECASGPQRRRFGGPGPGKWPPGRVSGARSRVSGPARPLGLAVLR